MKTLFDMTAGGSGLQRYLSFNTEVLVIQYVAFNEEGPYCKPMVKL